MKKLILILMLAFTFPNFSYAADPASTTSSTSGQNMTIQFLAPFPGQQPIDVSHEDAISIMGKYISQVFLFGMALISIFAVLMIMFAGYEYMFLAGDSGKLENAKSRITQALLGLVLVFLSALLLNVINPNFYKL